MNNGKVKWFDKKKGYGFITPESGDDVFVHFSGIKKDGFKTLQEGESVVYDTEVSQQGTKAVNVQVVTVKG